MNKLVQSKGVSWFLIFFVMLLYVILFYVFAPKVLGAQKPGDRQVEITSSGWLEKHQLLMNEALEAAEWIAGSDKEALGVLTNFKKNAVLITPITSQSILRKGQLGFLSLAEGDENVWREEFETPVLAGFSRGLVVFVNSCYKPTKLALGLSLIQEIFFAISAPVEEMDFFRVQAMAYDMSYRLMCNKFGWRYRRLVQEEQECLRIDPPIAMNSEVIKSLGKLFSQTSSVSEVEREFQLGLIWIHAQFQLLAEEYPSNIRAKINFLSILHEDTNSVAEN